MSSPLYNQLVVIWQDANGLGASNFLSTQDQSPADDGPFADLVSALQAVSDCGILGVVFQRVSPHEGTTGTGSYKTASDRAVFGLRSSSNTTGLLNVPGPKEDIFLSDHKTVDMTDSRIVDLVTAIQAVLGDSAGTAWATVGVGQRQKVRKGFNA